MVVGQRAEATQREPEVRVREMHAKCVRLTQEVTQLALTHILFTEFPTQRPNMKGWISAGKHGPAPKLSRFRNIWLRDCCTTRSYKFFKK